MLVSRRIVAKMAANEVGPRRFGLPKVRRAALDRLARGYADDDIDLEDYERRTAQVHDAISIDEITNVMHDVPDFSVDEAARASSVDQPAQAEASPPANPGAQPATMLQVLGDREFDIADVEGGALRVISLIGETTIDLGGIQPGETVVLSTYSLLGDLTVIVPRGCRVHRRHVLVLGDLEHDRGASRRGAEDTCQVVLRGFKLLGDVTIVEV
jgi:hypothetical protein